MTMFRFGCGHVIKDEAIHEASWGARLIHEEIRGGRLSIVYDRQTPDGDPEGVRSMFPVIEEAMRQAKPHVQLYTGELSPETGNRFCWRDGRVLVVMSPQSSYGYLYITAVLEREGHEGETKLADFEGREIKEFGNWPPHVVERQEAARLKREREEILGRVGVAAQDARWNYYSINRAKTETGKQRARTKQARLDEAVGVARQAALDYGFTEAEVDQAQQRGYNAY